MKVLGFVLLWLVGASAAVAVAWAGVSAVDDGIVSPAPASIPPPPPVGAPTSVSPDPTVGGSGLNDSPEPQPAINTPQPENSQTQEPSSDQVPTAEPTQAAATPTESATTAPTSAPTAIAHPTEIPIPATPAPASEHTTVEFTLTGGSTAIAFSPQGVKALWASPNPGFEVDVENEGSEVKVKFRSNNYESELKAWWDSGPRHVLEEDYDSDDD